MSETTFTADEAMAVRKKMRDMLGLGEEKLTTSELARMIGDEMEKLGDREKAAQIVSEVTGKSVAAKDLTPPER